MRQDARVKSAGAKHNLAYDKTSFTGESKLEVVTKSSAPFNPVYTDDFKPVTNRFVTKRFETDLR